MRKTLTKMLSVLTAVIFLFAVSAFSFAGNSLTANAADHVIKGIIDDYVYEICNALYEGEVSYENTENNGFSVSWDEIHNLTALKGKGFEKNSVKAYQVKEYSIDYSLDINTDGIAYVGVEGWMSNATANFHIVEAWASWQPLGEEVKNLGSVVIGDTTLYNTESQRTLEVSAFKNNDDAVSTIIRRDDTFTAEWNGIADYTCGNYTEYDEDSFNFCKDFDISYSADISSTKDIDMFLRGTVQNDNQWIDLQIHDCFKLNSYANSDIREAIESGKFKTVTVNGAEYYKYKGNEARRISYIYFYRKDEPLKNSDSCSIENNYALSDFLENWSSYNEEKNQVNKIGMYVKSYESNGYADFRELSFTKFEGGQKK